MSDRTLTYQDLVQIVQLIKSSSHFSEFHLKVGDIELDLRRAPPFSGGPASPAPPVSLSPNPSPIKEKGDGFSPKEMGAQEEKPRQRHGHVGGGELVLELGQKPAPPERGHRAPPAGYPEGSVLVKSPMVGTFYRAPEPGARPFVEVGSRVEPDTVICIIEVMKLMNSIPAGTAGVVTHILVEDGEPVEFGQVLMVIDSNG